MNNENLIKNSKSITLWQIFISFFKMGFTAFGPAMMVEAKKNIVKKSNWLSEREFLEGLALAQLIPGATFVSLTIYIGYKLKGLLGAIASFIGFILPPFFIMVILSWVYFKYQTLTFVSIIFKGLGAIVVALILNAVFDLAKTATNNIRTITIALISFIISIFYNNIFLILFISALLGIILLRNNSDLEKANNFVKSKTEVNWVDFIIISGLILLFFLSTVFSKELSSMFEVFFKIGALVFGNGFTMLPLIQQEVVNIHHWLNIDQFMVGVALGQMTPGPIVITATFIGYKVMGLLGALVATLAIFAPSFLLVVVTFGIYTKIKTNKYVNSALEGLLSSFVGLMTLVVINSGRHSLIDFYTVALFILSFLALRFTKLDAKWVILCGTGLYLILYYVF
ncbi:chromate transporter, chromate ion transporter (CHR) family [Thermoanaerobacterium xylanolyticum LX-11]|uniref:Chromate transporter, chromate ion transporter (CHR) family n=1 Tax=Thermoanaerobacterium xylanolyticum (strain ATCC 49914 / DSM 7097 / LX-11) TaxID=858215 RepID=F6BJF5_THEXL|nr:chromate efflux transporter [Thermoanaerobacterium xylanolyticum]AEF16923.1 chromate transporter, chromate ion transporter (CHR) family [Thermoanaerobacterium xylanolyticum LX-11]